MQRAGFLLCAIAALSWAQELRLSAGAADRQVFQRGCSNPANIELGGTADRLSGNIQARLTSGGNVPDGAVLPMIYRADLKGNEVHLQVQGKLPPGATLSYGAGKDPYCNLTDAASMGMLAFPGIAIAQ